MQRALNDFLPFARAVVLKVQSDKECVRLLHELDLLVLLARAVPLSLHITLVGKFPRYSLQRLSQHELQMPWRCWSRRSPDASRILAKRASLACLYKTYAAYGTPR